jgi:hypothetical protein
MAVLSKAMGAEELLRQHCMIELNSVEACSRRCRCLDIGMEKSAPQSRRC